MLDRHGRGGAAGPGAPAEADRGRLVGLRPAARLRRVPPDRRPGRRLPDGGHGPLRRPGGGRAAPQPGAARPRRHHDHPQDPGRPARRRHPDQRRRDRQEDQLRGLPRSAGRSAGARDRGQGGRLQAGGRARVPGAPAADAERAPRSSPSGCSPTTSPRPGVSVVSGGTDVHLVLVDLRDSELDGQQGEDRLHSIGITVNRNAVPFDPRPPMVSSGLRIGTPALATRGFGDDEFAEVADIIAARAEARLRRRRPAAVLGTRVAALAERFPLYPNLTTPASTTRAATTDRSTLMAEPLPEHPDFLWRNPEPKSSYDVVIVGAGGHGLATAYYLAKNHGITNIAVLERGWLAGGNMARNTAIIRSNYLWDEIVGDLRALAEAVGEPARGAGVRLPVQPARRDEPRPHPAVTSASRCAGSAPTSSTGSTPSGWTPSRSRSSARSSTSATTSATRCWARPSSLAQASPSTTTSRGRSPASATSWAST